MFMKLVAKAKDALSYFLSKFGLDNKEEEVFRCPCCGYAPCDCDDH